MKRLLESIAEPGPLRLAALASMCFAAGANAHPAHPKMVLSAYADAADGTSLLAGHYGEVIASLGSHGLLFKQDALPASTNLCVAYIMTHRWSEADSACDEAIEFAKLEVRDAPRSGPDEHDVHVAVAYSNRAVLELLEQRPARAAADLSRARALAPNSEFVAQNLSRLHAPLAAAGARSALPGSPPAAAVAAEG